MQWRLQRSSPFFSQGREASELAPDSSTYYLMMVRGCFLLRSNWILSPGMNYQRLWGGLINHQPVFSLMLCLFHKLNGSSRSAMLSLSLSLSLLSLPPSSCLSFEYQVASSLPQCCLHRWQEWWEVFLCMRDASFVSVCSVTGAWCVLRRGWECKRWLAQVCIYHFSCLWWRKAARVLALINSLLCPFLVKGIGRGKVK